MINLGSSIDKNIYTDNSKNTLDNKLEKSWADLVEEELGSKIKNKVFHHSIVNNEKSKINTLKITDIQEKLIDTNKIFLLKFDELTDLELLKYQTYISSDLRKLVKQLNDNIDNNNIKCHNELIQDLIYKLEWLINGSKYLSNKTGLTLYHHKISENDKKIIPRSSYKFCNYNFECEFHYNINKNKGCFAQHYVHNMVYADIVALKNYIIDQKTINKYMIEEIKKSINTISYVINHMYDELKNVIILNSNYELNYGIKNNRNIKINLIRKNK